MKRQVRLDFLDDNYEDLRDNRLESFYRYYVSIVYTGEVDPAYPLLNWIMDELSLDVEERYWLSFLYGHFYHIACAYWVFVNFPDVWNIDEDLYQWEKENYYRLDYEDDRTRERWHFAKCVYSYIDQLVKHNSEEGMFGSLVRGCKNSYDAFTSLYDWSRENILGFGRYTSFYYLETLKRCVDLNIDAPEMYLPEATSPRMGLQYVLDYFPERIDYVYLNKKAEELLEWLKGQPHKADVDYLYLESVLCAYKGLWRKHRYIGYYIDRSQEEIKIMEKNTGEDFSRLWQARKEVFPHFMLGELNGWNGRRKNLYPVFAVAGELVCFDRISEECDIFV